MAGRPELDTVLARFLNTYLIYFNGIISNQSSNPLPVMFDILGACSNGNAVFGTDNGWGSMYVVPEVGIVEMYNTCVDQDSVGDTVIYTYKILNTNIPL